MKRSILSVGLVVLMTGCGAPAPTVSRSMAPLSSVRAYALDDILRQDVVTGCRQIFATYDVSPKDGRLSYPEFSHAITRDWFNQHDTNHDGYLTLDEWLTPTEIKTLADGIVTSGKYLLAQADKNGDQRLTLDEYMADTSFVFEATPWLKGPADPNIKVDGFKKYADAAGLLSADAAALMIGDLLAQGYYLDDGEDSAALRQPFKISQPRGV